MLGINSLSAVVTHDGSRLTTAWISPILVVELLTGEGRSWLWNFEAEDLQIIVESMGENMVLLLAVFNCLKLHMLCFHTSPVCLMKHKDLSAFWQGDVIGVWDLAEVMLLLNCVNISFKSDFHRMCSFLFFFFEECEKDTKCARNENTHQLLKLFVKVIPWQLA